MAAGLEPTENRSGEHKPERCERCEREDYGQSAPDREILLASDGDRGEGREAKTGGQAYHGGVCRGLYDSRQRQQVQTQVSQMDRRGTAGKLEYQLLASAQGPAAEMACEC